MSAAPKPYDAFASIRQDLYVLCRDKKVSLQDLRELNEILGVVRTAEAKTHQCPFIIQWIEQMRTTRFNDHGAYI